MAKTRESGGWEQEPLGSGQAGSMVAKQTSKSKQTAKTDVVRDDWDDDDDEDDDGELEQEKDTRASPSGNETPNLEQDEESNKIWEEANKRAPMPEVIVARSQSVAPPPPAALQPTLRILKRPSPSASGSPVGGVSSVSPPSSGPSSASGGTSPAPRGTLAEREAQYQEARSRIFGEKPGGASPGLVSRTSSSSGGVVIVREPLGPTSKLELEPGAQDKVHGPTRGFGERRRGKK